MLLQPMLLMILLPYRNFCAKHWEFNIFVPLKMYFPILSAFYLFFWYFNPCDGFQIPLMASNDCFKEVKQKCDPKSIAQADVIDYNTTLKYYLFTRKNPKIPEFLHLCNGTLPKNSYFNPKNKLIMFSPGFFAGLCQLPILVDIKDEYLKKGDFNVILTDPTEEYGFDYPDAFERLPGIAKEMAKVLRNIQDHTGISNDMVDLAGHSLGAQLSGLISKYFRVHRITGVDPAGIHFNEDTSLALRLDPSDADLVDIFHCNGGATFPDFSIDYPAGDADFYINGGRLQPNCGSLAMQAMKGLDFLFALAVATGPTVCSHTMCIYYYHATINNEKNPLYAWECDNYEDFKDGKCSGSKPVIVGMDYEKNFTQGESKKPYPLKYFLTTGPDWPFSKEKGSANANISHS